MRVLDRSQIQTIDIREFEMLIEFPEIKEQFFYMIEYWKIKMKNEIKNLDTITHYDTETDNIIPLLPDFLIPKAAPEKMKLMNNMLLSDTGLLRFVLDEFFFVILPNALINGIVSKDKLNKADFS